MSFSILFARKTANFIAFLAALPLPFFRKRVKIYCNWACRCGSDLVQYPKTLNNTYRYVYLGEIEMNSEDLFNESFSFKKPLTSRYRKKHVEFPALGILQYCCGDTYAGFDLYDAPDISLFSIIFSFHLPCKAAFPFLPM